MKFKATMAAAGLTLAGGCASKALKGELLGLEPPREARGEFVFAEVFPWADERRPRPTDFETDSGDGAWVTRYEVLEGPKAGGVLVESRRSGPSAGEWLIARRYQDREMPHEERHHCFEEQGSFVMPEMLNFARGVRVEMTPPGVSGVARLDAGATVTRDSAMRLPLLNNSKKLREKGTGRAEITFADAQRVRTRAGAYDAMHLREVFTSRFSAASAVRTIDRWYAAEKGLLAERWVEEVMVLGVVIERSRETIRVLPAGE
jgi:hypothetical protein